MAILPKTILCFSGNKSVPSKDQVTPENMASNFKTTPGSRGEKRNRLGKYRGKKLFKKTPERDNGELSYQDVGDGGEDSQRSNKK